MQNRFTFGKMTQKAAKYAFQNGKYIFEKSFYCFVKQKNSRQIIAAHGNAAERSIEMTMYADVRLSQKTPVKYNGDFYLIAVIDDAENRLYKTASLGRCEAVEAAYTDTTVSYDEKNVAIGERESRSCFDCFMTEKYYRTEQKEVMQTEAETHILITDKSIVLEVGAVIEIKNEAYAVTACYMSSSLMNEFEIMRRSEV